MRGIKILLQDFALKMQGGGLCARGGVFAGHYGINYSVPNATMKVVWLKLDQKLLYSKSISHFLTVGAGR